ncbi:MAG TPA: hypothetical protein VHD83_02130 [Puia sp.]|nr:hypothetical protein [Puia sp.]
MKWSLPLLFLLSSLASSGQGSSSPASFSGGVEADILPFITGGYYMSVWGGYKHVRYRIVLTNANTPQFLLPKEFSNNELEVYALITDYFFRRDFRGCWVGTGLEWWKGQIDAWNVRTTGRYTVYLYTAGGGYVWNVYRGFYINPWAGIHLKMGGDHTVHIGELDYTPPLLTPEISLKIGWHF